MNVLLTPELEQKVKRHVTSGRFKSPDEVIGEGLRLLEEQEDMERMGLTDLRAEINIGLEQLERGEKIPGEMVFDEIKQRSRERQNGKL